MRNSPRLVMYPDLPKTRCSASCNKETVKVMMSQMAEQLKLRRPIRAKTLVDSSASDLVSLTSHRKMSEQLSENMAD